MNYEKHADCRCPHVYTSAGPMRSGWSIACQIHKQTDAIQGFVTTVSHTTLPTELMIEKDQREAIRNFFPPTFREPRDG